MPPPEMAEIALSGTGAFKRADSGDVAVAVSNTNFSLDAFCGLFDRGVNGVTGNVVLGEPGDDAEGTGLTVLRIFGMPWRRGEVCLGWNGRGVGSVGEVTV